ncbi:MAG: HlyD family efflux transporter periplasmic adaptor subunit [Pirellulales bacterium]|nr:HlyD family efflux transporter periplasmic adaptor subunit [Pirellulales bacterium]
MRRSCPVRCRYHRGSHRGGLAYRGPLVAIVVLLVGSAFVWSLLPKSWSWSSPDGRGPRMHKVERGEFIHDVTERGNVESASNVEIVSKVKSVAGRSYSGTTILEIVAEGTLITPEDCLPEETVVTYQDLQRLKAYRERPAASETADKALDGVSPATELDSGTGTAGETGDPTGAQASDSSVTTPQDTGTEESGIEPEVLDAKLVLVKLDSSSLETDLIQQQIVCENSRAAVIQARNAVDVAEISRAEYLEGTHQESLLDMEIKIKEAKMELSQAQQYLAFSERLERKGYITKQQLQDDRTRVLKAQNALALAIKQKEVLERYNLEKMDKQLEADILTAKARLKAEESSHQLDQERLKLIEEQIAHCTIYSTSPGQVVYANEEGHRGQNEVVIEPGAVIRENQVIIRLPDPTKMQVTAKINEARIAWIKPKMEATIQLDAFPDVALTGVVEEVSDYPAPTSWFRSDVKEYETIVKIHDPQGALPKGNNLRPGMTAQVQIRVRHLQDVVRVPVQTVIEHGDKHYCAFFDGERLLAHEVTIGPTNDKFVVIEQGLEPGQEIVLNVAAHREKLGLPELPPDFQRRAKPGQRPPDEGPPRQGPLDQGPPGQGSMGQRPPGQGPPGQGSMGQRPPGQGPPGQGSMGQGPPGQGPPGQGSMGQRPPGQGPPGQGPPGQRPPGQGPQQEGDGPRQTGPPNREQPGQETENRNQGRVSPPAGAPKSGGRP